MTMAAITARGEEYGPCECCGDLGESDRDPSWGNELLCLHCQPCFGCGEMGGDCDLNECRKPVKNGRKGTP